MIVKIWLVILIIVLICVLWNSILNRGERKRREETKRITEEYFTRRGDH